ARASQARGSGFKSRRPLWGSIQSPAPLPKGEHEMRRLLERRPSPAMIVALVAVVLGATGGALAGRGGQTTFVVGTATSKGYPDRTTPVFNSHSDSLVRIP